jgi:hypothetical protein
MEQVNMAAVEVEFQQLQRSRRAVASIVDYGEIGFTLCAKRCERVGKLG